MGNNTDNDEDVIDLSQLIAAVWQRRWWMIISIVSFTVVFATAAFVMRPVYSASTIVIPASANRNSTNVLNSALGQLGGLASLAGVSLGASDSETTEALAILRSREFVDKFITEKNLMPELFADKWDSANSRWKVPQRKQPTSAKAYKLFTRDIFSVSQDKKTSLVTIRIEWSDRVKAADWANELVGRINETMRLRAIENTEASIRYLEKELKGTSVIATQEAINRLIESQVKQRMLANVTPEYGFRVVDKAIASDVDEPKSPNKVVLIILGAIVGLSVGVLIVAVQRK